MPTTCVTFMCFSGQFRSRPFMVKYVLKPGDRVWTYQVEYTPIGTTMPEVQSGVHEGRAPCMTDPLRLLIKMYGAKRRRECNCGTCVKCRSRKMDQESHAGKMRASLRVFGGAAG